MAKKSLSLFCLQLRLQLGLQLQPLFFGHLLVLALTQLRSVLCPFSELFGQHSHQLVILVGLGEGLHQWSANASHVAVGREELVLCGSRHNGHVMPLRVVRCIAFHIHVHVVAALGEDSLGQAEISGHLNQAGGIVLQEMVALLPGVGDPVAQGEIHRVITVRVRQGCTQLLHPEEDQGCDHVREGRQPGRIPGHPIGPQNEVHAQHKVHDMKILEWDGHQNGIFNFDHA
mmetsp:Transcript_59346/g.158931  ORF Transcript_59346/g.158931 Transcript_59346/m.158931 type:complete len:230 (-) Transcript_59346:739-1428(-)